MIDLDTNVLARYLLAGTEPASASTARQQQAARRLIEGDGPLQVCKTVLLEFEWVTRGLYGTPPPQFGAVVAHLLALPHGSIEDRPAIEAALAAHSAGIDFADALHHASYRTCDRMASFDDRKFARRAKKLGLAPKLAVPR